VGKKGKKKRNTKKQKNKKKQKNEKKKHVAWARVLEYC
jgi:hypothetical protein